MAAAMRVMRGRKEDGVKRAAAAALLALLPACSLAPEPDRRVPGGYVLMEKAAYQALYDGNGRIERLLQDRDHDGRADAVVLYYPNGRPRLGEIDTDADGRVDRWEYFRTDGTLERVARSRAGNGQPDSGE